MHVFSRLTETPQTGNINISKSVPDDSTKLTVKRPTLLYSITIYTNQLRVLQVLVQYRRVLSISSPDIEMLVPELSKRAGPTCAC